MFRFMALFLGVLGHCMLSGSFESTKVLDDFSNGKAIEVVTSLFEFFLPSLRHGVIKRLLALSIGQRGFRTRHPGCVSIQAAVRIPERLDRHLVQLTRISQLAQQLVLLILCRTGGDECTEGNVEISDRVSCWRSISKDLIPGVLEFLFKRTRKCLEQGGTLMIHIADSIENLVAKMQTVRQHVLHMCGIVTFGV
jgi:hypothetical protein